MEALKTKYFEYHPDEPIVFHRKEIVNANPIFENLKNPDVRRKFDRDLLSLLNSWHYIVISVCLDNKKHKETYTTWRYDPYRCVENPVHVISSEPKGESRNLFLTDFSTSRWQASLRSK